MYINFSKPFLTTMILKLSNHIFKVNHACGVAWLSMLMIIINPGHRYSVPILIVRKVLKTEFGKFPWLIDWQLLPKQVIGTCRNKLNKI